MKKIIILSSLLLFIALNVYSGSKSESKIKSKEFVTRDFIYEPYINTVLLFPYTGEVSDYLQPAVVPLAQKTPLQLSFDDLRDDVDNYYVKIVHCNADWTVSTLSDIQFLYDYNEFFVTERETSINTLVPYVHYTFIVPKVKLSGNYIVKVYRDYNEEDLILTKRFMVYEQSLDIIPDIKFAQKVSERNESQQVNFTISYQDLNIVNPSVSLKVAIRQNNRWDKVIFGLPPQYVKEYQKLLEYNYFNMENGFKGGNQFNAFDISSFYTYKLNISKIINNPELTEVILLQDKPRSTAPYQEVPDIDGKFFIEHYETKDREVTPDYAYVHFVLDAPPQNGRIYVIGAMNDWRVDPIYEMKYDPEVKKYIGKFLLKQGYYNYRYTLVNDQSPLGNDTYFCGSHSETQNLYEVFAYYRIPGERADRLIGYTEVNFMKRN